MEHLSQFIMKHWLLALAFIIILALTLIYELIDKKKKAKALSPQAAVSMINNENAVVIDLRDKESFKNGHIIDAINASVEDFEQAKMSKYKKKNLILVCARGLQAPAAATKLRTLGFESTVLSGGIAAWQNADLPLVKGKG